MPSISDIANRLSALENGWTWLEACTFNAAVTTKGATSLATTAQMTAGTGITAGTGTVIKHSVVTVGNIIETTILIDVTGLNSGGSAGDIIGVNSAANCYLGRITTAINGTIFGGYMQCIETPATGEDDIDLYSATESTGTEDAAVSGLAETALVDAAENWTGILAPKGLTAVPAANEYLYLVSSGGATAGTYSAGKFIIKLFGYA